MDSDLRAIGAEAFYETPAEYRAGMTEIAEIAARGGPPEVVEGIEQSIRRHESEGEPSLRIRLFAEFTDGRRIETDGSSRGALLTADWTAELEAGTVEATLQRVAAEAAELTLQEDDWLDELAHLMSDNGITPADVAAAPRIAAIDSASVRRAAEVLAAAPG